MFVVAIENDGTVYYTKQNDQHKYRVKEIISVYGNSADEVFRTIRSQPSHKTTLERFRSLPANYGYLFKDGYWHSFRYSMSPAENREYYVSEDDVDELLDATGYELVENVLELRVGDIIRACRANAWRRMGTARRIESVREVETLNTEWRFVIVQTIGMVDSRHYVTSAAEGFTYPYTIRYKPGHRFITSAVGTKPSDNGNQDPITASIGYNVYRRT